MRVWRGLGDIENVGRCVVTLGNFDGVHRGHAMLLGRAAAHARERGHLAVALTFDPHPTSVVRPERTPLLITSLADRIRLLGAAGAQAVLVVRFTETIAAVTATEFAHAVLVDALSTSVVVVGVDFQFGARASGNVKSLRALGSLFGFEVDAVEVKADSTARLSSSRVRELLAAGEVAAAAEILGRPHGVTGPVITGQQRGRDLGFPTANVACPTGIALPADGVYAGWLTDPASEGGRPMPAAISVGTNPTFGADWERGVEAFVLGRHDLDLYGHVVTVSFLHRLRGMETFTSVEDLVAQMKLDVAATERLLAGR